MNRKKVASILKEIAVLLELNNENSFKIKAFSSAARLIETSELETKDLIEQISDRKVKGIGPQLTECILSLHNTGELPLYDQLRFKFSEGFLELLKLPGLGAKRLKVLRDVLAIKDLVSLEKSCRSNEVSALPGFGKKTQENILKAIIKHKEYSAAYRLDAALNAAQSLIGFLQLNRLCSAAELSGELRRKCETISNPQVAVCAENSRTLIQAIEESDEFSLITDNPLRVATANGVNLTAELIPAESFVMSLFEATGSPQHLKQIGSTVRGKSPKSEKDLYRSLGLAYIPPELREGVSEIEIAKTLADQDKEFELIELSDIKGVIHAHSSYSDGADSLETLALHLKGLGFDYLGITDHSQTASYAGGLGVDKIKRQHEEIEKLNQKLTPFKVFKGIESDILPDGSLDYSDKVLASFDFIIASVHSSFTMSEKQMTKRIIRALENPHTTILGHLSGRLLLRREPYQLNIEQVLEAAAINKVAVEINANPKRLELDWRWHTMAKELGILIPICPDAHGALDVQYIRYGVDVARKGGLTSSDVPNAWDIKKFEEFINK